MYCPHGPNDDCICRKPKPGLIQQLVKKYNCPPNECWIVGDSARDIEAAHAAGCNAILVKTGKGKKTVLQADMAAIPTFDDLAEAVQWLLS